MDNLEWPVILTPLTACFRLWEEAEVPGENPLQGENMQTPHRKAPEDGEFKPRTFLRWGISANYHANRKKLMTLKFNYYHWNY